MFRNTLTANGKYPSRDLENSSTLIEMQLAWKRKTFSDFFLIHFRNLYNISKTLKKKIIVIATLLRGFQAVKNLVILLSKKKHCFRTPFGIQHVKGSQTLVRSAWEYFHHIFSSLLENLSWKISPLVMC